jgi:Tfp pilus assembly protein PilO
MLAENLARLSRSKRNAFSASLIVIAAFALHNWTVKPQAARLSSARAHEFITIENARESRTIAASVESKRKELNGLREQSAQILSTLFTSEQAGEFFSDIEVISEQTGCAVHGINSISKEQKSEYGYLGVQTRSAELNVVGSYADITTLIGRLQARSQRVWLDSLELQGIDNDSDKIGCSLTMTIFEIVDKDPS